MTPKQYALGMTVRHLSGSSTLIGLLNGLGHLMSHPASKRVFPAQVSVAVLNVETARIVRQTMAVVRRRKKRVRRPTCN